MLGSRSKEIPELYLQLAKTSDPFHILLAPKCVQKSTLQFLISMAGTPTIFIVNRVYIQIFMLCTMIQTRPF